MIQRRFLLPFERKCLWRRLPAEDAAAAEGMGQAAFFGDHVRHRRPDRAPLDAAGLIVDALECGEASSYPSFPFSTAAFMTEIVSL